MYEWLNNSRNAKHERNNCLFFGAKITNISNNSKSFPIQIQKSLLFHPNHSKQPITQSQNRFNKRRKEKSKIQLH